MADNKSVLQSIVLGGKRPVTPEDPIPLDAIEIRDAEQNEVGPCGMISTKGALALDVERGKDFPVISLQYVYISVQAEFTPGKFWFLFVGLTSWKVTIEGRNLRPLFDRINDHCLRRIRQANRDFGEDDGKPYVTKIEIKDVTPKEQD